MSQQIPQPGTYQGKVNGAVVVYEAESGALCLAIPVILTNSDVAWHGKHTMVLVKKDGEVVSRSMQTLKEVFPGFDGVDPFWLTEQDLGEVVFDLVCVHEEFTPQPTENNPDPQPVMAFKTQWLNAPGGGSRMPDMADRKAILAKYGNKFRALAGGKPAAKPSAAASAPAKAAEAPAAKAPAKAPPTKGGPPAKAKAAKPTATVEEAWAACQKANPDMTDEQAGEVYYGKIAELFPGVEPGDLTGEQCAAVKAAFEV